MNYRHAYHAGSFADVVKHAALTLVIEYLKHKPAPFAVIDTHAGTGRYDLNSAPSLKTGEFRDGIARLMAAPRPPPALAPYLAAVRRINRGEPALRWYPGSPKLARALIRPGDRLSLYELHHEDARLLARAFAGDGAVEVHAADGWGALRSDLPPPERRGVVLIDPAYEERDEFARLTRGLQAGYRRWATGVFVLWYPIKDEAEVAAFKQGLAASGIRRVLLAEMRRDASGRAAERLIGSGLAIVNPPWQLDGALATLLTQLLDLFGFARSGSTNVGFLVPE
jgi:23S rRNA (adenine2030-N6)-methyltransferase